MEEVISKAFRTFLSSAIGSYPRFVKSVALERPPPEAISNDGLWLDQDAFVEGAPNHRTRLFRVSLRHTQMYEVFVRDRLRACAIAARSGKAQFGSDVKDEDLDEESALAAFGSEFQKEAKHVYRETQRIAKISAIETQRIAKISAIETQRIAKISAIGMRKGAKLVKEKFSTSLDAFKERRQRMKNLSSESLEVANTAEGGDLEWKRIDKTTTMSSIPSSTRHQRQERWHLLRKTMKTNPTTTMRPLPQQRTERMRSSVHPSVRQRDNKTTTTPLWTKRRTISSISSTTSFSARPLPHRRRHRRTPRLQPSLSSTCNSINKNKAAADSCVR